MIAVDNDAWEQWGIGRGGQAVAVVGMRVPRVDRTHWGVALTLAASSAIRTQHTRPTACYLKVLQHTIIDWHNITVLKKDQQNIYLNRGTVPDCISFTTYAATNTILYELTGQFYTGILREAYTVDSRHTWCKQTTNLLYKLFCPFTVYFITSTIIRQAKANTILLYHTKS